MRVTSLKADASVPPGLSGRVVLRRDNGPNSSASEIEWFDAATIESSGGWIVPETVNGFYYVLETES